MLEPSELFPEVPNLYEFLSVHSDMVFDEERVSRYSDAINQHVKQGDIIADVGTGTGLLAFLCIRAGAKRVHAIERSPAIKWARILAEHHGFSDRIIFYEQDSRQTNLTEKVDLIVSELIGHMAFEEGMIEALYDAKQRFLLPDGEIIPQIVNIRVALVSEKDIYSECINCWKPVYGIDYSLLREDAIKACYLTAVKDRDLLSAPKTFFTVDFQNTEKPKVHGSNTFTACRTGEVNGIVLWFDAILSPNVYLSSGPWTRTHWKQCFAPIAQPISVKTGDCLSVQLEMKLRDKIDDSFQFLMNIKKEL